jgi:hypothetical protein
MLGSQDVAYGSKDVFESIGSYVPLQAGNVRLMRRIQRVSLWEFLKQARISGLRVR